MATPIPTAITIPTNPVDLKAIRLVIEDISNNMTIAQDRGVYIREAKANLKKDYDLDAKAISAMIKWYHNNNSEEVVDQLDLYEAVFPTNA